MRLRRLNVLIAICYLLSTLLDSANTASESSESPLDVVCQATNDSRGTLVPKFPKEFEAHMEVTDLFHNYTAEVREYVCNSRSAVYRTSNGKTIGCFYDNNTKQGHVVHGIQCTKAGELPHQCFCNQTCLPFIPLRDIFAYMGRYNAVLARENLIVRGLPASQWSVRCWSEHNPNITLAIDLYLSRRNYPMAWGFFNVPVRVAIYSRGDLLRILDPNVQDLRLIYEIMQFKMDVSDKSMLQAAPGVFCPSLTPSKLFPTLAEQFSVTMETVLSDKNSIIYVHHHYDSVEKLVAYELRPHHHSPASLTRIYDIAKPTGCYRIVHDFQSGVQYMIDERSGNCSITPIPSDASDAMIVDDNHVRLRHANELLSADRDQFVFQGVVCVVFLHIYIFCLGPVYISN